MRLAGDLDGRFAWRGAELECDGMARPDGRGLRVTFAGQIAGERLTFVFGVPRLGEGESASAVPVNVTIVRPGGRIYGTRGEGRCTLDRAEQTPLDTTPPQPVGPGARRWRIAARGFCLEPARAVVDAAGGAILLSTFDFIGMLTWHEPPPDPPRPESRAVAR